MLRPNPWCDGIKGGLWGDEVMGVEPHMAPSPLLTSEGTVGGCCPQAGKGLSLDPEYVGILTLDFQPTELGELCGCCLRPPACCILVIVAKMGDRVGVQGRREVKTVLGTFVFTLASDTWV